jgi:hypothetical protein
MVGMLAPIADLPDGALPDLFRCIRLAGGPHTQRCLCPKAPEQTTVERIDRGFRWSRPLQRLHRQRLCHASEKKI